MPGKFICGYQMVGQDLETVQLYLEYGFNVNLFKVCLFYCIMDVSNIWFSYSQTVVHAPQFTVSVHNSRVPLFQS